MIPSGVQIFVALEPIDFLAPMGLQEDVLAAE